MCLYIRERKYLAEREAIDKEHVTNYSNAKGTILSMSTQPYNDKP